MHNDKSHVMVMVRMSSYSCWLALCSYPKSSIFLRSRPKSFPKIAKDSWTSWWYPKSQLTRRRPATPNHMQCVQCFIPCP